jgi:hypothetical protein
MPLVVKFINFEGSCHGFVLIKLVLDSTTTHAEFDPQSAVLQAVSWRFTTWLSLKCNNC